MERDNDHYGSSRHDGYGNDSAPEREHASTPEHGSEAPIEHGNDVPLEERGSFSKGANVVDLPDKNMTLLPPGTTEGAPDLSTTEAGGPAQNASESQPEK